MSSARGLSAASRELAGPSGLLTSSPLRPGPQHGVANARAGCGSLAFSTRPPCSSSAVRRWRGGATRGFPFARAWGRVDQCPALVAFASPSETRSVSRCPGSLPPTAPALRPSLSPSALRGLLSWGCQSPPLHRHGCLVSTPSGPAAPRSCRPVRSRGNSPCDAEPPSARSCHAPGLVPPLPFLPAPAACSTWHCSGLLHPETDPGVRHVSGRGQCPAPRPRPATSRLAVALQPFRSLRSGPAGPAAWPWRVSSRRRAPPAVAAPPCGGASPCGDGALVASRRGEHAAASYLPRWRVTLRSFSLADSCTASRGPSGSHPDRRFRPGRVRVFCDALGGDRPGGSVHRGRCPLAVARWEA